MNSDRGAVSRAAFLMFLKHTPPARSFLMRIQKKQEHMQNRAGDDLLFCAGSLYLIGELKVQLKKGEKIQ